MEPVLNNLLIPLAVLVDSSRMATALANNDLGALAALRATTLDPEILDMMLVHVQGRLTRASTERNLAVGPF